MTTGTAVSSDAAEGDDGNMSTDSADGSGAARTPSRVRYALILGGLTAFGPLSIDMYLPALPTMTDDLHTTDATLQLTLTAFVIGLAVGQLVIGPVSDAFGRRKPLLIGMAVYVAASILAALSPTVEALIAARAIQALGAAAGIVVARATVRDLFAGKAMTRFFSMLMLVTGCAPILAPIAGGQILSWTSWRGVFLVLTGFGALLLVVITFVLPEPLPEHRRSKPGISSVARTYLSLLRERTFLGYALTAGLIFAALFAYISGSSFVLQGVYGLSAQQYSLVFGLNGLGIVILGQVNGRLAGRFDERNLLATGVLAATVGAVGMVASTFVGFGLLGLLIPLVFIVASIGLIMPNCMSLALANHPNTAGSASALLGVLQFIVGGLAAPLVSIGGKDTAVPMAVTMAGFALLALLAFSTLTRPRAAPELATA